MSQHRHLSLLKAGRRHITRYGEHLVKTESVTNMQDSERRVGTTPVDHGTSTHRSRSFSRSHSGSNAHLPELTGFDDVEAIFRRNREWAATMRRDDPNFFNVTGATHSPDYLWIGCADARVAANQILGLDPGEVFVHRNIANLVVNTDLNMLAVLQYAVEYLEVKHIFVCGHYDCGGIKAALQNKDYGGGILDAWIRNVRDVMRLHSTYLDSIIDSQDLEKRLVELNTIEQAINLFKTGIVQRSRLRTAQDPAHGFPCPRIHAVVYDPADGLLKGLPTNWKTYLHKYRHIYDLYESHKNPKVYEPDKYDQPDQYKDDFM